MIFIVLNIPDRTHSTWKTIPIIILITFMLRSRKLNMVIICLTFELNCWMFNVLHKSVWEAKIFEEICTKQSEERILHVLNVKQ